MLGVDLHQQVALLHQLVVAHRYLDHVTGHIGRHVDDIGAHAAVAGPGCVHVMDPEFPADHHGDGQDEQGAEQAEKLFHQVGLNGKQ
ncbi:hypothetical protein D3C86_1923690 [compost metagenome]